jgi:hypothetical protein
MREVLDFILSIALGEIRHHFSLLFRKLTRGLIAQHIAKVLYLVIARSYYYNRAMCSCV